ncbi:MAG: isoprenylcysteine carboxylmethyltransferase family protein [bacterium]
MDFRQLFFKLRSYTPIPLLVLLLVTSQPRLGCFLWGLILMLLGELLRLWAVAHAGGATRTRAVGAPTLVTSGPFAHTRNPLYIANTMIYLGVALLASGKPIWVAVALGFSVLQYSLIVSLEEETLRQLFGVEYEMYQRSVPRWLPRLTPWSWSLPRPPDWKDAWRNEKHTRLNLIIVAIVFAVLGVYLWITGK